MNTRLASRLTALMVVGLALLPACKQEGEKQAAAPDQVPTQAPAAAEGGGEAAVGSSYTMGVVLGQGAVVKAIEAGMKQVAPANAADLKVGADPKALLDQKVNAIVLVGASSEATKAAGGKVPVIVVGGDGGDKAAAQLASGTALDTLTEAQAKELGRVAVETAFSVLKGDKDIETNRSMQSIL